MTQYGGTGGVFKAYERLKGSEFVYLRARHALDPRNQYNPYALQVVPRNLAPKHDHFTLSRRGITHFRSAPGTAAEWGTPTGAARVAVATDFTPWKQWVHHFYVFHHIRQLHFFRTFRRWRVFASFKRYIRLRRMAVAALTLSTNLHCLRPVLQRPLAMLRRMMHDVQSEVLVYDPADPGAGRNGEMGMAAKPWVRCVQAARNEESSPDDGRYASETDSDEEEMEWTWGSVAHEKLMGALATTGDSAVISADDDAVGRIDDDGATDGSRRRLVGLVLQQFRAQQSALHKRAARRMRQFGRCVRQVLSTACDDLVLTGPSVPHVSPIGRWHEFLTDADYHAVSTAEAFFWLGGDEDKGVHPMSERGSVWDDDEYQGITMRPGALEAMPYSLTAASRQNQRLAYTLLRVTQMRMADALAQLVTANTAWLVARLHDTRTALEASGGGVSLDVFEAAFKAMDLDGSGALDAEEVEGLMRLL